MASLAHVRSNFRKIKLFVVHHGTLDKRACRCDSAPRATEDTLLAGMKLAARLNESFELQVVEKLA